MAEARNYNAWLLDRCRPYLGRRVLDVGAGIGTLTELLAPLCELVVAVEPDPAFLARLRRRFAGRSNVVVLEAEATTLAPSSLPPVDSAVCLNVLEHIPDDAEALRRLREQLPPGGRLLLLVPAHPSLYGSLDRTAAHERRYGKEALRRLLEQAGFAVEVLRHVNPVGTLGWLVSARLLRRARFPEAPLRLYDRLLPILRPLDRLRLPFGLSLWAVARRS